MKKGFTLTELLVSIVIITMLLMIALPTISNIINKNNRELCNSYEKMVIEYAMVSDLKENDIINVSDLDGLDKVNKECPNSYVTVDKTTDPYTYIPHLNCPKCQTTR